MTGTVEIERIDDEDWYTIHSEFEVELMIKRLIPTHKNMPLRVRVHPENTRLLRMIMGEFPFEIKSNDKWTDALGKIAEMQELQKNLSKLNYVEPDGTHFIGKLLPFQKEGLDFLLKTKGQTLVTDEMGLGKAQPLNAKVLTPYGWSTIGSLKIGDYIVGVDGKPVTVTGIFPQGKQKIFEVCFNDGSKTRCTEEHLWSVKDANQRFRNSHWRVLELRQINKSLQTKHGNSRHFIPIVKPIEFYEKTLTIDPYLLGVLLGDGGLTQTVALTTADLDILENIKDLLPEGIIIKKQKGDNYDYRLSPKIRKHGNNTLINELRKMGLMGKGSDDKFIPAIYLEGSIKQRVAMIQGLLDTDGYISKFGTIQYSSNSEFLIKDLIELIRSVGGITKLSSKISASKKRHWIITISLPNEIIPFRLNRKLKRWIPREKYKPYRCIKSIEYVGIEDAKCIKIDRKDGLYVTDDYIVTHNTIQTLAFIASTKDAFPVVIVSPLTTLVNWKREIERFIRLDTYLKGSQSRLDQLSAHMPIIEMIRTGEDKSLDVADIYIINYDLIGRRLKNLKKVEPRTVVCDEIQYVRNSYTGRYEAVRELALQSSVKYRIGLSGTPIYNKGVEMYNIIEIIKSGLLGEREEFIRRYCNNSFYGNENETSEQGKTGLAKILRNTIMIRRKKADVLPDLPEKVKMKQVIPIDVNLYTAQLGKLFEQIELAKENLSSMTLEDEKKEGLFALNKKVQEMRQGERQIAGLAKAPFVVQYMQNLLQDYEEEKFVIFCHHISVHEIIYDRLNRYGAVQIIGGQSDKQRQEAIDKFQNDPKTRVIICGLRAGNLGISLTKSTYVIFAELDWSPAVHWQAEDRLHRIGQTKTVFAHYLEGEDTFDEIISQILLNKNMIINDVLGDKMERLNNNQAIQFLQEKYKFGKDSKTLQILEKTTQID